MKATTVLTLSCCVLASWSSALLGANERPVISAVSPQADRILLTVNLPAGFRHAVLEEREALGETSSSPLIAGPLNGGEAVITFNVPRDRELRFLTLRAGPETVVPPSTYSGPEYISVTHLSDVALTASERVGHVLNRVAYGPTLEDLAWVQSAGVGAYLEAQLQPATINESTNTRLSTAEAALFDLYTPHLDTPILREGDIWHYFKGTQAPPANWAALDFADSDWLEGPSGFGFSDDDDATELTDMVQTDTQTGYVSVFVRKTFTVSDPASVGQLLLPVDFDDGFVAYLNGTEVARTNVTGDPPAYDVGTGIGHEAGTAVEFDLTAHKALLRPGSNVLAIQGVNFSITSSDFSLIPALVNRTVLPEPPMTRIRGIRQLKQLPHLRGAYARRQLQAVLAEFWDNHFTTDADKLEDYFDGLRNSDATDAMSAIQAEAEAAQAEYEEYQFFHDHALGRFGDLLLYSATSPPMLVYLDSILNRKGTANENYAREILELFAFGVDNRYVQTDIEQLARCFTGWTVRKAWPSQRLAFPASARTPLTDPSVQYNEEVELDLGPGWVYFKGLAEPSPDTNGLPTLDWTRAGFDTSTWLAGATGIGYGDNDDATVLTDMRNNYGSVYLRRTFTLADADALEGLMLAVAYDDGYVAYINGVEVARSRTMATTGTPPPYNRFAIGGHEASQADEVTNLEPFRSSLKLAPEENVLAIQVHNLELSSSDLSMRPRLIRRQLLPGSIENGDPNGAWVFRFNPDQHDTNAKSLFTGTEFALTIPAGRTGIDGVQDALEVIDSMVSHPSTREFLCLKLINRFVSDDISLISYRNGTAPEGLRQLMDDALAAWMSTTPPGHIETVMRAILRPQTQDNYFWTQSAYRVKVKTPVEFINSSVRAVDATATGTSLATANGTLGMDLFTRDDPDGWSELGLDWVDTLGLLERVKFVQRLAGNLDSSVVFNVAGFTNALPDLSAAGIVSALNARLYDGHLSPVEEALLVRFATTDDAGQPLVLDPARTDYQRRVRDLVSLVLGMPQWQRQ